MYRYGKQPHAGGKADDEPHRPETMTELVFRSFHLFQTESERRLEQPGDNQNDPIHRQGVFNAKPSSSR